MLESSSIDDGADARSEPAPVEPFLQTTASTSSLKTIGSLPAADTSNFPDDVSAHPDFSILDGHLCLDTLSVRELHQAFRATFGRQTASKDKLWLKRRIAMALSNSCQIPTMNFLIKDHKVTLITGLGAHAGVDEVPGGLINDASSDKHQHQIPQVPEANVSTTEPAANPSLDQSLSGDGLQSDHKAAKRVRKPTKRYIEELSEIESNHVGRRPSPSVKMPGQGQTLHTSHQTSITNVYPHAKVAVTRLDSIGGSGVQVPFVSRIRRCRPRENIASLLPKCPQENRESPVADVSRLNQKHGQEMESKSTEGASGTFDGVPVAVPHLTGEMSRKHHRAWTLSEVMKLVEGVSRYGAGKWSEIKRYSFTSYPHRSSVDLKDKWRNLLRASLAESSHENRVSVFTETNSGTSTCTYIVKSERAGRKASANSSAYK
uniref:Uncharacterized protein n=1 Tax=Kalanchoe fedtschenkoi TaxID=63787 RepID=A0A7N0T2I9_KALFE